MQRHKKIAWIVLLILFVINLALAAPVLVRGIREVPVNVVDVAEDNVITASRKRWTNAADRANTPSSLGSADSDNSHPLPVGSPPPVHNNLPLNIDLNNPPQPSLGSTDSDNSHPLPGGSPPPVHNNLPLNIDLNDPPQPSLGSTDSDNPHPLPVGSPHPVHNNLPLNIDLNDPPQ